MIVHNRVEQRKLNEWLLLLDIGFSSKQKSLHIQIRLLCKKKEQNSYSTFARFFVPPELTCFGELTMDKSYRSVGSYSFNKMEKHLKNSNIFFFSRVFFIPEEQTKYMQSLLIKSGIFSFSLQTYFVEDSGTWHHCISSYASCTVNNDFSLVASVSSSTTTFESNE